MRIEKTTVPTYPKKKNEQVMRYQVKEIPFEWNNWAKDVN